MRSVGGGTGAPGTGARPPKQIAPSVSFQPPPVQAGALHAALVAFRTETAKTKRIRAYHVFTNKELDAIVARRPCKIERLRLIDGFGHGKVRGYGTDIVRICLAHSETAIETAAPPPGGGPTKTPGNAKKRKFETPGTRAASALGPTGPGGPNSSSARLAATTPVEAAKRGDIFKRLGDLGLGKPAK